MPLVGSCSVWIMVLSCLAISHSVLLLEIAGLPALVEGGFGRAVEPDDGEIPSAGHRGEPVAFFALRSFRPEIEVRAAVSVLRRLVARTERGERLAVGETRSILRLVERHRPEVGGGDAGRQTQAIVAATQQGRALVVGKTDHIHRTF